jgi:tetratricopeptide (TPR) repeat protein
MTFPTSIALRGQAQRLVQDGARFIEQGRSRDAILVLRQALALQPRMADAYCHLGHALQLAGQAQQALQTYQQALTCDNAHIPSWLRLAELQRQEGRLNDAVQAYRRALALRPDLPEIHHDLGMLLDDMGHHIEAESAYRQAIHWRPGYAEAHQSLGALMVTLGRLDHAEQSCRQALALQSRSIRTARRCRNTWPRSCTARTNTRRPSPSTGACWPWTRTTGTPGITWVRCSTTSTACPSPKPPYARRRR